MADILRAILAWVEWVIAEAGYPGLALAMLLETVFPPIPSEAILPFAGVLARRGTFDLAGIVVAATLGSVAGALILYGVGRWVEDHVVVALVRRYGRWIGLSEATLARALTAFQRHGLVAVFVGRLLPGLRSIISIPAGMARLRMSTFLLVTALGSGLWNALFAFAGWYLGEHWEAALKWVAVYEEAALVLVIAIAAAVIGWALRNRPTGAPPAAPA